MTAYSGHCFCGHVRFAVAGPPLYACFCHCESCRRAAGAAYVPWAVFDKRGFAITSGELAALHSAPGVTRGYCRECGTSLTYESAARAGQVDITITSFDEPSQFSPQSHVWVEDKLPWVVISDGLPQYAKTAG
jgi:hypothetical protein